LSSDLLNIIILNNNKNGPKMCTCTKAIWDNTANFCYFPSNTEFWYVSRF